MKQHKPVNSRRLQRAPPIDETPASTTNRFVNGPAPDRLTADRPDDAARLGSLVLSPLPDAVGYAPNTALKPDPSLSCFASSGRADWSYVSCWRFSTLGDRTNPVTKPRSAVPGRVVGTPAS